MPFNSIFRILANVHLWGLGLSIIPHILPYARAFFLNLCKRERGQDPKCAINLNLENLFFQTEHSPLFDTIGHRHDPMISKN